MATTAAPKVTKKQVKATKKKALKKAPPINKHATVTKRISKQPEPSQFLQFRITQQSLYWLLFGAASILFTLQLYSLDAKVRELYDQIDRNNYSAETIAEPEMMKKSSLRD